MLLRSSFEKPPQGRSQKRKREEGLSPPSPPPKRFRAVLSRENLRKHTQAISTSVPCRDSTTDSTSRSVRTTDPQFSQKLRENGVTWGPRAKPPLDISTVETDLARERASGSPSSEEYDDYRYWVEFAGNESTIKATAFDILRKKPKKSWTTPYIVSSDHEWTNVGDSDLTNGLVKPKPDYAESYALDVFTPGVIHTHGRDIQPSAHNFSTPRFASELKGPNDSEAQAIAQASYDGAVMVESIVNQKSTMGKDDGVFSTTHALTVTSNGTYVGIEAHHAVPVEASHQPHFHSVTVFEGLPTMSKSAYSETRKQVRNAQEWAYKKSTESLKELRSVQANIGIPTPVSSSLRTVENRGSDSSQTSAVKIKLNVKTTEPGIDPRAIKRKK